METPGSDESLHFIHFGCWNQGGCSEDGTNPLSLVMQKLKTQIRKHSIQFLTVAGDNYYPIKTGKGDAKTKTILPGDLVSGFACLPKNIPIYLLLGNHDLDNSKSLQIKSETGEESKADNCFILKKEGELIDELNLIRPKNEDRKLVMHKLVGSTLIIMIDTTMYDLEDRPDKPDPTFLCYDKAIGTSDEIPSTTASLMNLQKEEVESIIAPISENSIQNIIVIGHHPLFVIKTKKENPQEFILDKAYSLFYDTLFSKYKENPVIKYHYLCADFHSYQSGIITLSSPDEPDSIMNIHQEIVGTGGTELDDDVDLSKRKTKDIDINHMRISYDVKRNSKSYGFLDCKIINGIADFKFKTLLRTSITEKTLSLKGGRKTRKRIRHNLPRITR